MVKRFKVFLSLVYISSLTNVQNVFAVSSSANGASMSDWASSYALQGTTNVYYNAPWLVDFVQFFISWACIMAFLAFYLSFLCSIVVVSNKELFYTIDALKRDKDNNGERKGMFGTVIQGFKNGSADAGLNGGIDNIVVLILSMSLNFKFCSVYKNVEAGSDDGDSKSSTKFAYSDTIMSLVLKSLPTGICFTIIISMALSGLLIKVYFNISDVFIVKAERFSQTVLVSKLDEIVGNDGAYTFSLSTAKTKGSELAESVARKIYANILGEFPNITREQMSALGKAVEDAVFTDTGSATGVTSSILGGDTKGYDTIYDIVKVGLGASYPLEREDLASEEAMESVSLAQTIVNTNPNTMNDTHIVFSLDAIMKNAGVLPPKGDTNLYIHVSLLYNHQTSNNYLQPVQ